MRTVRTLMLLALPLAASSLVHAGCGGLDLDVIVDGPDSATEGNLGNDAGEGGTGEFGTGDATTAKDGSSSSGDDTQAGYCAGKGPPVLVGGDGGFVSTCQLAKNTFRYALCTCDGGFVSSHALRTDAFDSTKGPYSAGSATIGGSVGSNGNFSSSGEVDVGGSLWASSPSGITLGAASQARAELHSAGNTSTGPTFAVGTDAFVADNWNANGSVSVPGKLTMPAGKTLTAPTKTIGTQVTAPVSVGPACDCDPSKLLDIGGIVESFRTSAKNDNAAMGIDPAAFESVQTATTRAVPCGRLFLTRISTSAPLTLTLTGRTAIFIAGDVALGGDFKIDVPNGAELDLFIEGNVVASGAFQLGSSAAPATARAYVGGTGTINLSQASTLAGNVYAPKAEAVLASGGTVYGSVFVRRLATQGDLTIHFDESIVKGDPNCTPPSTCKVCGDCGGGACVGGKCGSCTDSSQCCAPLLCQNGSCVASIR